MIRMYFLVHCTRIPLNTACSKGTRFGQSAQWWQAGCWLGVNWDESRERFLVVFTTMAQFSGPVVNRSPTRGVRAAGCWDLDPKGLTRIGCVQMFLPYIMHYRPTRFWCSIALALSAVCLKAVLAASHVIAEALPVVCFACEFSSSATVFLALLCWRKHMLFCNDQKKIWQVSCLILFAQVET
jgi:hypothetical protein